MWTFAIAALLTGQAALQRYDQGQTEQPAFLAIVTALLVLGAVVAGVRRGDN